MTIVGFVALAAAGTLLRWAVGSHLNADVPIGTFAANVVASLAIGYLSATGTGSPLLLQVALLGTLSTWSSVASEVAIMMRASRGGLAALYLSTTLIAGVAAAWVGLSLGA